VGVLFVSHERCLDHLGGPGHPERPGRIDAVSAGLAAEDLSDALIPVVAVPATDAEVLAVHDEEMLALVRDLSGRGGGAIDPDTRVNLASLDAARLAAGAGLEAVRRLDAGEGTAAFCAVRPPGHHATRNRSMGFCLFNNVAVSARYLVERGERVLIVDYDAHHGNGTQDVFYTDDRVLFVSLHQDRAYPGTGELHERGAGDALGFTLNLPLPAHATGDVYMSAWDSLLLPAVERFAPTWVLLSAGFDAHRADPLTSLGLTSGDFADLTAAVVAVASPGRLVAFLEGGYDLTAVAESAAACVGAMVGVRIAPEAPSAGGPGADVVDRAAAIFGVET
jgi:acetoin utilization deacetylase AcuC-like enzyme